MSCLGKPDKLYETDKWCATWQLKAWSKLDKRLLHLPLPSLSFTVPSTSSRPYLFRSGHLANRSRTTCHCWAAARAKLAKVKHPPHYQQLHQGVQLCPALCEYALPNTETPPSPSLSAIPSHTITINDERCKLLFGNCNCNCNYRNVAASLCNVSAIFLLNFSLWAAALGRQRGTCCDCQNKADSVQQCSHSYKALAAGRMTGRSLWGWWYYDW